MTTRKAVKRPIKPAASITGVHIGASPATIAAAQETIIAILSAPHADEATKRTALQAFDRVCSVNNANISNVSVTQGHR